MRGHANKGENTDNPKGSKLLRGPWGQKRLGALELTSVDLLEKEVQKIREE